MAYYTKAFASVAQAAQAILEVQVVDYTVNSECSGCGECCSNLLPMSRREIEAIRRYMKRHNIREQKHFVPARNPVTYDAICPFCSIENHCCVIYEVRPEICRAYRCDKAKNGEFTGHFSGNILDYMQINVRETFFKEG